MIFAFFILFLSAVTSFGATNIAANATRAAFATTYSSSVDGDTIIIPAGGTASSPIVWSPGFDINKAITIQGTLSGTNWATFVKNATDYIFKVDVSSDKKIRISYIDFDHNNTFNQSDKAAIYINDANGSHTTNLRIDHCYFGPGGSRTINGVAWWWGVIDHCYFNNSDSDISLVGFDRQLDSGNDGTYQWTRSKVIGDTNRVVIENNTFHKDNGITSYPNEVLYGQGTSRAIFRYNYIDATSFTAFPTPWLDAHGKFGSGASGQIYSTIGYEAYGNTVNVHHGADINLRGGRHQIYSNTVTTISGNPSWLMKDEGADTYGVPPGPVRAASYNSSPATTGGQWTTNCFWWANTVNGSAFNPGVASSSTAYVVQNTHYFLRAPTTGDSSEIVNGSTLRQLAYPHPRVAAEDAPPPAGPVIGVTGSADFGTLAVNTTSDVTLVVQNVGTSGTVSGTATVSTPFSIVSGGTYSLTTGQQQNVVVRFSPTSSGGFSQTITFPGGGGTTVQATGTGVDPNATFYVAKTGSDSNDGSLSTPWLTISKANSTLTAGQSVEIKVGKYNQGINPVNPGSANSPISYRAFGTDQVTITGNVTGITISGKRNITVSGIQFTNVAQFASLSSATNCVISNCVFYAQLNHNFWGGFEFINTSQSNRLVNSTLSVWGWYPGNTDDNGDLICIGDSNGGSTTDKSWYNRIEGNTVYSGAHSLLAAYSGHSIIRSNYFHNEIWSGSFGGRGLIFEATPTVGGQNLFEGNKVGFASAAADAVAGAGVNLRTRNSIFRRNTFIDNTDAGIFMDGGDITDDHSLWNQIYHNTFYRNGLNTTETRASIGLQNYGSTANSHIIKSNSIVNNIMRSSGLQTYFVNGLGVALSDQRRAGNWEDAGDPRFVDVTSPYDPTSATLPNLSLASNSTLINAGAWLTTITSSSGSGTSFVVGESRMFQDGWGGIAGDQIQLQGQTTVATITAINYTTHTITFTPSLTWTTGTGVAMPYSGSTPDAGAFEFAGSPAIGSVALSASTYSIAENGGSLTVSLVRSGGSVGAIGVTIATANGTAVTGSDYTAVNTTVTWADGDVATKTVLIPIIDDGTGESSETFTVSLSNATGGATIGTPSTATVTISDNDPIISIDRSSFAFGTVTIGSISDGTITVQNIGNGTLSGSVSGLSAPYSILSGGTYSLSANQSQVVTIRFSPTVAGAANQTATFPGGGGTTAVITGTGTSSQVTIKNVVFGGNVRIR
jgi:hypothetical protein